MTRYAELHAHSSYSFLHGANQPAQLVQQAKHLGLEAIGILDYHGMYSVIQTHVAAKEHHLKTVFGTELTIADPHLGNVHLPVLAQNLTGYHELCALISQQQLTHTEKTTPTFTWETLANHQQGNWTILTGTHHGPLRKTLNTTGMENAQTLLAQLKNWFGPNHIAVESTLNTPYERETTSHQLAQLARTQKLPLIATTGARAATPKDLKRAHLLTAIKLGGSLAQIEPHLEALPPLLRSGTEMTQIHHHYPQAVTNAADLAQALAFDMNLLKPQLPQGITPPGETEATWLRKTTYQGAHRRYGTRQQNPHAWNTIDHELNTIENLGFCGYFLIVKEIVDFCHANNILCQGRGSAANSAVCYSLGITAVDAVYHNLMFERFLSPDRQGPPDIDIDIEAGRREEVIQHVYQKYGRHNAAQVANTITYRNRSAIRDTAKAFGYSEDTASSWSRQQGNTPIDQRVQKMATQLSKLPRHTGIHSGGMILTRQPVSEICPIQWATMPGRTVLQWDKEDCAEAGLVKFDLLGLGMLTALQRMFTALEKKEIHAQNGEKLGLYNLPPEDPAVYNLLCQADTIGVFQVESRAQMNTLPRLKPRCFYDLVIEVALVRPGPIQGNAVNPYLRRRLGKEKITYIHPILKPILKRTLGIPLFQEQLMQIAVEAGGFTPTQADQLRKAMGSKHSAEKLAKLKPKLYTGLAKHGITGTEANQVYEYFKGFAEFGFPESHAFSFAYIVYASAWMKVHHPAEFYAAIISSQPMGFYSVATLIADARRHHITVLPPDINHSNWHTKTETNQQIRLGLHQIKGLDHKAAQRIIQNRHTPYQSIADTAQRANLNENQLRTLAFAGAFESLGISRRQAAWQARYIAQTGQQPTLPGLEFTPANLPKMTLPQQITTDYQFTRASTTHHPLELIRTQLHQQPRSYPLITCRQLTLAEEGQRLWVAGVVTHRQRPHTAGGITFLSLEDETGLANVMCSPGVWQRFKAVAVGEAALLIRGTVQTGDGAFVLVADKIEACAVVSPSLSRDFR